jgi:hypothetical protein
MHFANHLTQQRPTGAYYPRSGLSVLEFIACILAVIGGAWIGALFLGIDVRQLAHVALSETGLLERVPAEWRPASPHENLLTREQIRESLRKELDSLHSELYALRTADNEENGVSQAPAGLAQAKQKTFHFWQRLNEIARTERALQHDAESAFNTATAAKVFAVKSRISRFAAKAVEAEPGKGVEPAVMNFARQVSAWYNNAADLHDRAARIWDMAATNPARAQLNKEWQAADLQQRNEARLLHERATALRSEMSRLFNEPWPEFAAGFPAAGGASFPVAP